ncbi:MAG: SMP-30/gluconolactonase/LRE family protein [Pirellulales bacterium]
MIRRVFANRPCRCVITSIGLAVVLLHPCLARGQEKTMEGIGPAGKIKRIDGKFDFTEGPVWISDSLYFTDIPNERLHRLDAAGKVHVFVEKSKHANGLFAHSRGEIYACQMDGRLAAYTVDGAKERVLVEKFGEHRFNAPNDLVIDAGGGVYFTDPAFSAPKPLPQGKTCVYYLAQSGQQASRLIEDLPNPNGVILSPDEKTLYVIPSGQAEMMAYPVESPGKLGQGRVLCKLEQAEGQRNGGGDGLTVDRRGNLYITSKLGLQVFTPEGKLLGIIQTPEQPANVTFGGKDLKTLYVTARTSLYKIPMHAAGHQFPGGKNDE